MDGRNTRFQWSRLAVLAVAAGLAGGCQHPEAVRLPSPYCRTRVVAIAPFINLSGSRDVEMMKVTDLFFSELQMVRGLQVLPLNRTLQAMDGLRMQSLTSPADVVKLAEAMGVDLLFVGAVTSYDPYDPPEIGLAVQVYTAPGRDDSPAAGGVANPFSPRVQVTQIYNAKHEIVQKEIKEFADIRGGKDSPLGWKLYTKSIQEYTRFCCYQAIHQIMQLEQDRVWLDSSARASGQ